MKQPIFMIRGTTQTLNIDLSTVFGEDYVLSENEVIHFGVKKHPTDRECLIKKELTNNNYENGVYVLILSPSDTENLPFGSYFYDVGLQNGNSYFNVIECSRFNIRYNITSKSTIYDNNENTGVGGNGLSIYDDGSGNVIINTTGTTSISDDGNGNVTIR